MSGLSTCCHTCKHERKALAAVRHNKGVKVGRLKHLSCPNGSTPCEGTLADCRNGLACSPCETWRPR